MRQRRAASSEGDRLEQELQRELKLPRVDVGDGRGNGAKTASARGRVSRQQANRSATRGRSAAEVRIVSRFNWVKVAMFRTLCPPADAGIWSCKVGRVGDVIGLGPELQRHPLGQFEVLKDRQIRAPRVWSEKLVTRLMSRSPGRLRRKGIRVQPVRKGRSEERRVGK